MLYTSLNGLQYVLLIVLGLSLIILVTMVLKYKIWQKRNNWLLEYVIWLQSVLLFSIFKWFIAILILIGAFTIEILFIKKLKISNLKFFISAGLASLIYSWLPTFYELIPIVNLSQIGSIESYFSGLIGFCSLAFVGYHIGFNFGGFAAVSNQLEKENSKDFDKFLYYGDIILWSAILVVIIIVYNLLVFLI